MPPLRVLILILIVSAFLALVIAQVPSPRSPPSDPDNTPELRLPNGRLQRDEMLKADHAKNIEDARELLKLCHDLKTDLEKNTQYVFSIADVKKTEEIEKAARRIRSRMKRY
jgi:hypothetical protein